MEKFCFNSSQFEGYNLLCLANHYYGAVEAMIVSIENVILYACSFLHKIV